MRRIAWLVFVTLLSVLFLVGCSDKMAREGDLSTGPDLAGALSSDDTDVQILELESEDWDGVSPIEEGKFYCFKGEEQVRKAFSDDPEVIEWFETVSARYAPVMELRRKEISLLSQEISRDEAFSKARRVLSDFPETLTEVERRLNQVSFPCVPVPKAGEPQIPRRSIKVKTVKKGHLSEEARRKAADSAPLLSSENWGEAFAYCKQEVTLGTNGWTTYPDFIKMWVVTDGYAACQYPGEIKWPFYRDVVLIPEYWLLYSVPYGYVYDPGVEIGVDAGVYTMSNGVTMATQCGIRVIDWYTYAPIVNYQDEDSQDWPSVRKGDCNLDGTIDIFDVLQFLRYLSGSQVPLPGDEQYAADMDENGVLDNLDLIAILHLM